MIPGRWLTPGPELLINNCNAEADHCARFAVMSSAARRQGGLGCFATA